MKKLQNIIIIIMFVSCGKLSLHMNNETQNSLNKSKSSETFEEILKRKLDLSQKINRILRTSLLQKKLGVAKKQILQGANLQAQHTDRIGDTSMHIIVAKGYNDLFDYIYSSIPKINKPSFEIRNKLGETLLWSAYKQNKYKTFKKLIDRGADINACRENNESLFYRACTQNKHLFARMLASAGADPNITTTYGDRSINWVASKGYKKLFLQMESLYQNNLTKYRINFLNSNCLFLSLKNNKFELFKIFLELGTDPTKLLNKDKEDILSFSFKRNKRKYFKEILKYTDINNISPNGDTIIHKIARKGNKHDLELIDTFYRKELLKSTPNYDRVNELGETPLYLAYKNNNSAMFVCILEQDVNADQSIPNKKHNLLVDIINNKKNLFAQALIIKSKKLYIGRFANNNNL